VFLYVSRPLFSLSFGRDRTRLPRAGEFGDEQLILIDKDPCFSLVFWGKHERRKRGHWLEERNRDHGESEGERERERGGREGSRNSPVLQNGVKARGTIKKRSGTEPV